MLTTPKEAGFRQPAEWSPHRACWLAWPADADLWLENLAPAQAAFASLCEAIASGPEETRERLEVLVLDDEGEAAARSAIGHLGPRFHRIGYGDIWLRDTAPIFVKSHTGEVRPAHFAFNGWGGKYVLDHDADVARKIAALHERAFGFDWILEGGSVEVDGRGTILTTRQCLLNPNRNKTMDRSEIERALMSALGGDAVLWLGDGLVNDHTDGHIDTIARFVAPGVVVCMEAESEGDPNRAILRQIEGDLRGMRDATGARLHVETVPSPGRISDANGQVMPASYVNFYIANHAVVVPTYGAPADERAVAKIARLFPSRRTIGVPARAILSGGGAFHCITQQEPRGGG